MAACLSLILHAGILAIDAGSLGLHGTSPAVTGMTRHDASVAAPLRISLAPYRLEPALTTIQPSVPQHPLVRLPRPQAPAVADMGIGIGEHPAATDFNQKDVAPPGLPLHEYLDADKLSNPPVVLEEVDFSIPELDNISGAGKAILVLYINEAGRVDRTEVETAGELDTALVDAVARQFGKAIFLPAQVENTPVKSRLRVEILLRPLLSR